jgi:sugar phosphate isomerase/epimerase
MRVETAAGPGLLSYCANVHPGETLADVLASLSRFAGPVRRELGAPSMGLGLWLSRRALTELRAAGVSVLRDALAAEGLVVATMNGFPYGNFQGEVVKREVYRPDLSTDARREYLFELAEVLAALVPADTAEATISTLPLGHRDEMVGDRLPAAARQLARLASDLAALRDRTGRSVRVCLEPEPGCVVETTAQAVRFFTETLPAVGLPRDLIAAHLGVSFDTCHQAVQFESPASSLALLADAGVRVGKVQLSSALVVPQPSLGPAQAALARFDEPRFLHQVRCRVDEDEILGFDDLGESVGLPMSRPWRVHFHVPIHRELMGGVLSTTRSFLTDTLRLLAAGAVPGPLPHLEVETYTWSVLPEGERPEDDAGLIRGLAAEMRFVLQALGTAAS